MGGRLETMRRVNVHRNRQKVGDGGIRPFSPSQPSAAGTAWRIFRTIPHRVDLGSIHDVADPGGSRVQGIVSRTCAPVQHR